MRSRQLPWSRTLHLTSPPGVTWTEHDDHVAYTADTPLSSFHHRLLLDEPPESLEPWKARWDALHGDTAVKDRMFAWEGRAPVAAPEGRSWTLWCLMADQAVDEVRDARVAPLQRSDLEAMVALYTLGHPDADDAAAWGRWMLEHLFDRDDAALVGVFEGGQLASMATLAWDAREARYHAVITHPDLRRRGLAELAVTRALQVYQEVSFGIAYVAASEGTPAEALYRKLGFRRATAVTLVSVPR
ncbi:MAG: GNAT family N-acetyltransferase [Alphaproteobacteria bacterium]|nr:GNAT family N-acetyltransferase [Alphaproteobacteria bacterium]